MTMQKLDDHITDAVAFLRPFALTMLLWIAVDVSCVLLKFPAVNLIVNLSLLFVMLPAILHVIRDFTLLPDPKKSLLVMAPAIWISQLLYVMPFGFKNALPFCLLARMQDYGRTQEFAKAEATAKECLEVWGGQGPGDFNRACIYNVLASAARARGDFAESEVSICKAIEYLNKSTCQNQSVLGATYADLGVSLARQGKHVESIEASKKGVTLLDLPSKQNSPTIGIAWNNLGVALNACGQSEEALQCYQKSHDIKLQNFGAQSPQVGLSHNNLACSFLEMNDYDSTARHIESAKKIFDGPVKSPRKHVLQASLLTLSGDVHRHRGEYDLAEKELLEGKKIYESCVAEEIDQTYLHLGRLYRDKREVDKAREYFAKAIAHRTNQYGAQHYKTLKAQEELAAMEQFLAI